MKISLFFFTLFSLLALQLRGQDNPFDDAPEPELITIKHQLSHDAVAAGEPFQILTSVTLAEGWNAYYRNVGASGLPLELSFETPEGVNIKNIQWQAPYSKQVQSDGKKTDSYYYKNTFYFVSHANISASASAGTAEIKPSLFFQICKKTCLPPTTESAKLKLNIAKSSQANAAVQAKIKSLQSKLIQDNQTTQAQITIDGLKATLEIETTQTFDNLSEVRFISDTAGNSDPTIPQQVTKTEKGYKIAYQLSEDHEVTTSISGIITTAKGKLNATLAGLTVQAKVQGKVAAAVKKDQEHEKELISFTPAEKAAHAALYKGDEKINFTTLKEAAKQTVATTLIFAFIGGLILNLMPCVFPVLGLKVMGFAQLAGNDPKKIKIHGLVFTLGVLVSMWILAGIILGIRASVQASNGGAGGDVTWGQQMGNPIFVGCIVILLFIMGLNMYGVFDIGTKMTSVGGNLQDKKGYQGSFFSGILTTLIATPCSGPFLGATMSYTLGLPAAQAMVVFTIFALGISSPYLVLAFIPALIKKLPNPGAWMEVMKKFMAFPLFATAVFFLKAFGGQTGVNGMFSLSMAMVLFGLAAWAYGTWSLPYVAKKKRWIWGFTAPALIAAGGIWFTQDAMRQKGAASVSEGWQNWHPGLVEHHLSEKKIVWVDYTADW